MLTLDTLRRMADRMPSEPAGSSGKPAYRRPAPETRLRHVTLPSLRDETRRAAGLFGFAVIVALATLVPTGVLATHAADFWAGTVDVSAILRTALWVGTWTLAFMAPFAGIGLGRELYRYRRARATIGDTAILDATGVLRSEDGTRTWPL